MTIRIYLLLLFTLLACSDALADIPADWILLNDYGVPPQGETRLLATDGTRLYVVTRDGIYTSLDDGETWQPTDLLRRACVSIGIGPSALYVGTTRFGLFRSEDHGASWQPKNNGFPRGHNEEVPLYPYIRQILSTTSGTAIALGYPRGTYVSNDRGETWHDVTLEWYARDYPEWKIGSHIWSMTEFDGYWWAAHGSTVPTLFRSPDNGGTWEMMPGNLGDEYGTVHDWAVLDDQLYVAGNEGVGRWSEVERSWDSVSEGLPPHRLSGRDYPIRTLAVNRGRLFAGFEFHGVFMFDARSERWIPAGLHGEIINSLITHQSDLYAATRGRGIHRASIPTVLPFGKAASTWGTVKRP